MRLYRALLLLLPASFRGEYGGQMCAVLARRRAEATGPLAVVALWIETIGDLLTTAVLAHGDLLRQDLRHTFRSLRRSPGFATVAILMVSLGVGATTATFSMLDHVLIRPLPFPDPDRLIKLWQDQSFRGYPQMEVSPPNYRDWKRMTTSFESMAAYRGLVVNLVGEGDPQQLEGASVNAELFPMLGRRPLLGRLFSAADDREGAPGTVLLSHPLWKTRFAGDPNVVGRQVVLDGASFLVVGVMPADFYFPSRTTQIWTSMRFTAGDFADRTNVYLHVLGKLRPGVALPQARAELNLIASRLERAHPQENKQNGISAFHLHDQVSRQSRLLLTALAGGALGLLLIACTNLASLLLARALVRRRELAVRTALGAGRERLVRQLLTESLVLTVGGGALGVLLATTALPLLVTLVPNGLPIAEAPALDLRVLAVALALTALTGIGFGVGPALRAAGSVNASALREGRATSGARRERLRSVLVTAQVTLSVVLLISTGLLIRSLWRVQGVHPGFRAEGVLTLRTYLPLPRYEATATRAQFYQRVLSGVRALPGVSQAAYASFLPIAMGGGIWPVKVETQPLEARNVSLRFLTPGYFDALAIPVRRGRDLREADTREAPFVAVVSESFARRYWPDQNPLGRRFEVGFAERTVVGVVGDVRVRGLERTSEPQVYVPYQQVPDGGLVWYAPKDLVIRSQAAPGGLLPAVRRIVASADPQQPISHVRLLSEIVEADSGPRTAQVRVLAVFAGLALLLAGLGIHGLLAFTVSSRTQEIGVRIALGADRRHVLHLVLGQGLLLAGAGVALGLLLAAAAGRALEALLFGVSPADKLIFATAVGVSLAMTLAGSLLPALRALRVDPLTAMRTD